MGSEHSAKAQKNYFVSNLHGFGHIIKYYFFSGSSTHIRNNCKLSSKLWTWTPLFSCHISISGHDPTSFDKMPGFVRLSYIKPCPTINPESRCSVTALSQTGSSAKTVAPDALLAEQKSARFTLSEKRFTLSASKWEAESWIISSTIRNKNPCFSSNRLHIETQQRYRCTSTLIVWESTCKEQAEDSSRQNHCCFMLLLSQQEYFLHSDKILKENKGAMPI